MDYRHRYHVIVFVFNYLCISCFLLMIVLAGGDTLRADLAFVILMGAGYFLVSFKMTHESKKETEGRERLPFVRVFVVFIAGVFLSAPDVFQENQKSFGILGGLPLFVLLLGAFGTFIYAGYFHEKYLTMYSNQCVNHETIRRFEKNTRYALKKFFLVLGVGAGVLFLMATAISSADIEPTRQERQEREQEEPVKDSTKVVNNKKRMKQIEEQEKKQRSPFWDLFVKVITYVVQVVIVLVFVIGIVAVVFFLLRKIFGFRLPEFKRVEKVREVYSDGSDEYIPLRPNLRKRDEFPADSNGRIRRYFARYMKKKTADKVDTSLTPWEMAGEYLSGEDHELSDGDREVVEIYEKARYSGGQCSDEEAEQMKNLTHA